MGGHRGGWGGRWKKCPEKTRTSEQSTGSREAQWTSMWSSVPFQVNAIHLMHSTGAIVSVPHRYGVKSCFQKSRPIKSRYTVQL